MIQRRFDNLLGAYRGLVEELGYSPTIEPLKWGVCLGFPEVLSVKINDIRDNETMHLGMASFTKSRWTRFLRKYFRSDLQSWVDQSMDKLQKYPSRPFVCSYDMNHDTGHNYGGCLSSLQIRINPQPEVILYSRACMIDKIGFLDLSLMNVVASRMGFGKLNYKVKGHWVVTLGFISAISEIYYLQRFNMAVKGHRLEKTIHRLRDVKAEDIKFGPLARGRKRMLALAEFGEIPKSIAVSKLSIDPEVF